MREQMYPSVSGLDIAQQMTGQVQKALKEIPPGTIRVLSTMAGLWAAKKLTSNSTAAGLETAAGSGVIGAGATWAGAGQAAVGDAMLTSLAGGTAAEVGAVVATALAPPVLIAVAAYLVGWVAEESIKTYLAKLEANDRSTRAAAKNGMMGVYVAAANRGKQQNLWTSEQLRRPGQVMNNFVNYGTISNEQDRAALSLVLSTATDADVDSQFEEAGSVDKFVDQKRLDGAKAEFKSFIAAMQSKINDVSARMKSDLQKMRASPAPAVASAGKVSPRSKPA